MCKILSDNCLSFPVRAQPALSTVQGHGGAAAVRQIK